MRVSREGGVPPIFSLSTITGGGNTGPSGHSLQSLGSNGQVAWASNIASVTANGSNYLIGPHVNFISGDGITLSTSSNGMTITATGSVGANDFLTPDEGGGDIINTVGASGATETIDLTDGNFHDITLTADCTFTFASVATGRARWFTLQLTQDGTGGRTVTWPGSVSWIGGAAPTLDETAGNAEVLTFYTLDGGTSWVGAHAGGSGGDPATTVESETTFGISAAVGTDTEYARQDHTHGSPANPVTAAAVSTLGFTGELLITDTPAGTPLVFADILQNEAQDELLYADL